EALLPVAPPIHQIADAPARFAFDAVFEVDDDLQLAERTDARLVNAGRADVPEPLFRHRVLVGQQFWPEHVNMRPPHVPLSPLRRRKSECGGREIAQPGQATVPALAGERLGAAEIDRLLGRQNVTGIEPTPKLLRPTPPKQVQEIPPTG